MLFSNLVQALEQVYLGESLGLFFFFSFFDQFLVFFFTIFFSWFVGGLVCFYLFDFPSTIPDLDYLYNYSKLFGFSFLKFFPFLTAQ